MSDLGLYRNDRLHRPPMIPRAPFRLEVGQENEKPLAGAEVCARVEDDDVRPYVVVRGGHCNGAPAAQ